MLSLFIAVIIITHISYSQQEIHCNGTDSCDIICEETRACQNDIVYCPEYEDCNVFCIGSYSCQYTKIVWSIYGENNIFCSGSACYDVNFPHPKDDIDFHFICDPPASCTYSDIFCPSTANCKIECMNYRSCRYSKIQWSLDDTINSNLTCRRSDACVFTTKPPIFAPDDYMDFYINCTENICYDSVITCPLHAECHIVCHGYFSCDGTSIIWPKSHPYSISCNGGKGSCARILYKPYDNHQQNFINCTEFQACEESYITCPKYADCNILCDGYEACQSMVAICPNDGIHQCDITCIGGYSCASAIFYGNGIISSCIGEYACNTAIFPEPLPDEPLSLLCEHESACLNSHIYCPKNGDCYIECNGDFSCKWAVIQWSIENLFSAESILSCNNTESCEYTNGPPEFEVNFLDSNEDFYVNCGIDYNCTGNIIQCPTKAGCYVKCIGAYSCMGSIFNWTENQTFFLDSFENYDYSLRGITIHPFESNLPYNVDCGRWMKCEHSTIICASDAACNIYCGWNYACLHAIIYGPVNHSLSIFCGRYKSCRRIIIYAQETSDFFIDCGGSSSCQEMHVWVPANVNDRSNAIIDGADRWSVNQVVIFAEYGWQDVNFTRFQPEKYGVVHHGIMVCGSNYDSWCKWDQAEWRCESYGDTTCDNVSLSENEQQITSTNPADIQLLSTLPIDIPIITIDDHNEETSPLIAYDSTIIIVAFACGLLMCILGVICYFNRRQKRNANHIRVRKDTQENDHELEPQPQKDNESDISSMMDVNLRGRGNSNLNVQSLPMVPILNDGTIHEISEGEHSSDCSVDKGQGTTKAADYVDGKVEEDKADDDGQEGGDIEYEYKEIMNILRQCDALEWKEYLQNFKNHKITDDRLSFMIDKGNDKDWDKLIPELGVRYQFISIWTDKQNVTQYL